MTRHAHCGRWVRADPAKHGGLGRLVCTLSRHHPGPWHVNGPSGWMWSTNTGRPRMTPEIVREWCCRGWVPELNGHCGRKLIDTEDGARVKGWRIQLGGIRDQLCPQCGRPDPETAKLARELERSVRR